MNVLARSVSCLLLLSGPACYKSHPDSALRDPPESGVEDGGVSSPMISDAERSRDAEADAGPTESPSDGGPSVDSAVADSSANERDADAEAMPSADAGDVVAAYCEDFVNVWREQLDPKMNARCSECFAKANARCAVADRYSGCPANSGCVRRNCVCYPGVAIGDCAADPFPDNICTCVDSCMTPGPSECRSTWHEQLRCFAEACDEACR